jgi:hypothetical protein
MYLTSIKQTYKLQDLDKTFQTNKILQPTGWTSHEDLEDLKYSE